MEKRIPGITAAVMLLVSGSAGAQGFPAKPVRFITVAAPGTDIITRIVAQEMQPQIGQQIVVENRTGGSGLVGADAGAKAPPDGYSVLFSTSGTMITNNFVIANMPFDTFRDLTSLSLISSAPSVLLINQQVTPVKNMKELVDLAKKRPGELSFGSFGIGSLPNLVLSWVAKNAGTKFIHVPYKGSSDAYTDLYAGRLTMFLDAVGGPAVGQVKSGKLYPVAVTTLKPHRLYPNTGPMAEAGVIDFEGRTWWGTYVPVATPREISQRWIAEFDKALANPKIRERILETGSDVGDVSGERFVAYQREEYERFRKITSELGIKPE
jgi:tripartite-type tricarboxylate transporter receptor subunit TctC